jgi:hypothetical protein
MRDNPDFGKPIWINIKGLYPPPEQLVSVPGALELPDVVPGMLTKWIRTSAGDWLAVCNFQLGDKRWKDQLLPGHAVKPRGSA